MRLKQFVIVVIAAWPMAAQVTGPSEAIYVVQSASRRPPQSPESGLAPGSLCDINASQLYQPIGSLPREETPTFRFRAPGASETQDLTIVAVAPAPFGPPTQFTALIPTGTPTGQGEILAISSSGKTFSAVVWIASSNFGIFTKTNAGYDSVAAQVYRDGPQLIGLTTPVRSGEWVTLWGTGLGNATASTLTIDAGGVTTVPAYAGPAPGLAGVDQINFQFPAGVASDCYIPISVKLNGRAGNIPTIATANAQGPCRHRLGLTASALATLDQGGRVPLSQSWVYSDVVPAFDNPGLYRRYDTVSLDFLMYDAAGVQSVTRPLTTPVAGCSLSLGSALLTAVFIDVQPLDSGTPVVTGPGGVRIPMDGMGGHYTTPLPDSSYKLEAIPPSSFTPGDWAVEVPGGKDISPTRVPLRTPPALLWKNRATLSAVSRTADLVLSWDPAGYTDQEWMQGTFGAGGGFVACQAPATAGSITIPAALISQVPATTAAPMVQLLLTSVPATPLLYSAPLVSGGSVPGLSTFSYLEAVTVELK
jgi:uncharacterized protein (TIGR03437 family)